MAARARSAVTEPRRLRCLAQFPSDWWSNGRSPFADLVACLLLEAMDHVSAATWRREGCRGYRDFELFEKLHEQYGFDLFAEFFRKLRRDRIDLGKIGTAWPAPDGRRSAYAIAYLSGVAGDNLARLFREHGVGQRPRGWEQRHLGIPFVEYEVTPSEVDAILAAREFLFREPLDITDAEKLRHVFRRGGAFPPGSRQAKLDRGAPDSRH